MQKLTKVLVGLFIAGLGVIYALNALDIADINIFFEGWWTLFIIIPCTVSLFTSNEKIGSILGIIVGVALLLSARGIIEFKMLVKLIVPTLIIVLGLRIAFDDFLNKGNKEISSKIKENEKSLRKFSAILTSNTVDLSGQSFDGAILSAVLGSLDLNLNNAAISGDTVIRASCWFGSIDINVPEGVNVRMSSNSIFGDAENKKRNEYPGAPTVYVKCVCVFGGIDLK